MKDVGMGSFSQRCLQKEAQVELIRIRNYIPKRHYMDDVRRGGITTRAPILLIQSRGTVPTHFLEKQCQILDTDTIIFSTTYSIVLNGSTWATHPRVVESAPRKKLILPDDMHGIAQNDRVWHGVCRSTVIIFISVMWQYLKYVSFW